LFGARDGDCLAIVPRRAHRKSCLYSARWLHDPQYSRVERWASNGRTLPIESWADARIGQSLKIIISLTIAKI